MGKTPDDLGGYGLFLFYTKWSGGAAASKARKSPHLSRPLLATLLPRDQGNRSFAQLSWP